MKGKRRSRDQRLKEIDLEIKEQHEKLERASSKLALLKEKLAAEKERSLAKASDERIALELDFNKIKHYLKMDLEEKQISQTKQAELMGMKQATLNRLCKGERGVGLQSLLAVCSYLGKTPDFFITMKETGKKGGDLNGEKDQRC